MMSILDHVDLIYVLYINNYTMGPGCKENIVSSRLLLMQAAMLLIAKLAVSFSSDQY